MSIVIATPDGGTAEFPDGTSPDAMRSALRAKFGGGPGKAVAQDMQKPDYAAVAAGLPDEYGMLARTAPGAINETIDTAKSALKNTPSSAANFAANIAQPFIHPIDTATNIGKIGKGVMQKLGIMEGKDAEPFADAVGKMLVDRYGSGEAIKKTLATDPVGVAADIATVLSGGRLIGARAPGIVGQVARAAGEVGRAVDPLSVAGKAVKGAGYVGSELLGVTTGAGGEAIRTAARAGAEGGEAGRAFRESATGALPVEGVVEDARKAVSNLRVERGDIYRREMAKVGADKDVLDFDKIDAALANVGKVKKYKGVDLSPSTADVRGRIAEVVDKWRGLDPKEFHTAEGLDALKQTIGDIRDGTKFGTPERVIADQVYKAVRQTIVDQVPAYGKIMKGYEEATKQIKEIEKTLSLNPNASVDTALRKITSALRDDVNTNYGRRKELVAFLARAGAPHLLQKIAGQSLKAMMPRGLARLAVSGEGAGAIASFAAGHPAVAAGLGATLAMHSPFLAGMGAYGAGAVGRLPLRGLGQASRLLGASSQ